MSRNAVNLHPHHEANGNAIRYFPSGFDSSDPCYDPVDQTFVVR